MYLRLLCVFSFILAVAASGSDRAFVFPGARGFGVHTPAGARPRDRDAVDRRIVASFRERTRKIIDSQTEVGGYPRMTPATRKLKIPEKNIDEWLAALASELE